MKKLEQSIIDQIEPMYIKYGSAEKVGKELNIDPKTAVRYLKKLGYDFSNKTIVKTISYSDALNKYKNWNESLTKFCKKYHICLSHFTKYLRKNNIFVKNLQNECKFNEHIFDIIDTEEKAYWLGFIFADGYISSFEEGKKSNYRFELSLKESDINHLNKFNLFMEHKYNNVKVENVKCKDKIYRRCRWSICNKHLWETLNSYGCVPKKSLILQFPNTNIFQNKDLIKDFIRGYWDGDGCISYANKQHTRLTISALGTESFLKSINEFLPKNIVIYKLKQKSTWAISANHNTAFKTLYFLYENSKIYLDRKYDLYRQMSRLYEQLYKVLSGKIGEDCDVNIEIIN